MFSLCLWLSFTIWIGLVESFISIANESLWPKLHAVLDVQGFVQYGSEPADADFYIQVGCVLLNWCFILFCMKWINRKDTELF